VGLTGGDFVSAGGGGVASGLTLLVGSGKGVTFRLAFALSFVFAFELALMFAGTISSVAAGETAALALTFAFALGTMAPPDGIPSSTLPVGGGDG
jgi:hypothetical protein